MSFSLPKGSGTRNLRRPSLTGKEVHELIGNRRILRPTSFLCDRIRKAADQDRTTSPSA